jgi:hypothetical protein
MIAMRLRLRLCLQAGESGKKQARRIMTSDDTSEHHHAYNGQSCAHISTPKVQTGLLKHSDLAPDTLALKIRRAC